MKAIVYDRYGPPDVLRLEEVPRPIPSEHEVLVEVRATSVNAADRVLMRAHPYWIRLMGMGLRKPKHRILGFDVAGRVEQAGRNVEQFEPGDEVFGACEFGGFAEQVCVAESRLAPKPAGVSFGQAAAVPTAGCTALQGLRDRGGIEAGQKVLIDGASGGVGTFAVQIAKAFGADVTAVCSTRNVDIARSIGADRVIDYTREDFTRDPQRYDLILAANAYRPIWDYSRALRPHGTYVMTGGGGAQIFGAIVLGSLISTLSSKKMGNMMATARKSDLVALKDLIEAGKIEPVVDRAYALSDVPEAFRYMETEHARGKIVITM